MNSDPIDPDFFNPDSSLEIPPSSEFHDCPIVSDVEMKLAELAFLKGDINVFGPQPAVDSSPVEPFTDSFVLSLVEDITQHHMPAVVAFQRKLFGYGFSYFQLVIPESTTLLTDPIFRRRGPLMVIF